MPFKNNISISQYFQINICNMCQNGMCIMLLEVAIIELNNTKSSTLMSKPAMAAEMQSRNMSVVVKTPTAPLCWM